MVKRDIAKVSRPDAGFGDPQRGFTDVDIDDLPFPALSELVCQHDCSVARTAAGYQRSEWLGKVTLSPEDVVIDFVDVTWRTCNQPPAFVVGITWWIGMHFILRADNGVSVFLNIFVVKCHLLHTSQSPTVSTILPVDFRPIIIASASPALSSGMLWLI